jgi:putative transposase
MLPSLQKFDANDVAREKLKIIEFYDTYSESATKAAFGADRKVVSRWKQRLTQAQGKVCSLVPHSTRPKRFRQPETDQRIVDFIRTQRETYHRIGKDKLKPDVDEYCQSVGIPTIATSTIGKVLKRHTYWYTKNQVRMYHNPTSLWAKKSMHKQRRLRIKHSPKPTDYGHILSDTVIRMTDGMKQYFISAIDAKLKFALTLQYPRHTATNMKDFYHRFREVYPCTIRIWQSDNGSENLGVFDDQLEQDHIPHLFIYPRCPKIDTFIERYNRTLQEECLDYHPDILDNLEAMVPILADWNVYYNTKRRHHSLGLKSPLNYLIEKGAMSQMCVTSTPN